MKILIAADGNSYRPISGLAGERKFDLLEVSLAAQVALAAHNVFGLPISSTRPPTSQLEPRITCAIRSAVSRE
jgi:hypothetical protein